MQFSAGAARRGASASPSSCRRSTPPAPESRSFPRSRRLTRAADLQAVRREGKRIRTTHVDVRVLASPLAHPRVGIVVPRFKHTAVARNLVKRRLRELVRLRLLPTLPPVDVVLRAQPAAYDATFAELGVDVDRAAREIRRRFPAGA